MVAIGISLVLVALAGIASGDKSCVGDKPCAARHMPGKSVVCVCNETYCDEIHRDEPPCGYYFAYTSSKAGSRFKKRKGQFHSHYTWSEYNPLREKEPTTFPYKYENCSYTLVIDPTRKSQTIEGFGGAVTDSAGIHWTNLSACLQDHLISSYFSEKGIEYNMLRVPIGGCDFSTHEYAYNTLPWNDAQLTNYTLAPEDFNYKVPMIKRIQEAATTDIHMIATVWSPPRWMKTNEKPSGFSEIKPEFMQTYADYIVKFIREYKKLGISTWAVTTTNEPQNAFYPIVTMQDLGWTPQKMGQWIKKNLGPTIKNSSDIRDVKILTVDDQRYTIPMWFNLMVAADPSVLDWIDGIAVHWYGDMVSPALLLQMVTKIYPTKFVIGTEACEGGQFWQKEKVSLGDWSRAQSYCHDIMEDLNYDLVGWIDWNLCLDKTGGPNWAGIFVDSPIIVFPENNEFVKQPMFYAMGHFSKWIPRGSVRLIVEESKGPFEKSVEQVAFLTPRNTVVLVVHNTEQARKICVQLGEKHIVIELEKASITTMEFPAHF